MSSTSHPITPARFAAALSDLPLSALYAKASELRNSMQHMERSNAELTEYARENDDRDCYEALMENKQVLQRFAERIALIRSEVVEKRGLMWQPEDGAGDGFGDAAVPGEPRELDVESTTANGTQTRIQTQIQSQTMTTNGSAGGQRDADTGDGPTAEEEGVFL